MRETLIELILKHGIKQVKCEIDDICKTIYEDLKLLYVEEQVAPIQKKETRGRKKKVVEPIETPVQEQIKEEIVEEVKEEPTVIRKRIIKKFDKSGGKEKVNIVVQKLEEHGGIDAEDAVLLADNEETEQKEKTPREIEKEKHLAAIEAKRLQVEASGIDPESLLTKENLEMWLNAGKSYQRIAKEHVGLHEMIVSQKAREYGMASHASKFKFYRKGGIGSK
jgi:hypothetical protein